MGSRYKQSGSWTGNFLASFLKLTKPAKAGIDGNKEYKLTCSLGTGTRYRIDDPAKKAIQDSEDIDWSAPGVFYVVRETIAVTSIDYTFSRLSKNNLNIGAGVEAAEASGSLKWSTDQEAKLVHSFTEPHHVFFLPQELTPVNAAQPGSEVILTTIVDTDKFGWTEEERR